MSDFSDELGDIKEADRLLALDNLPEFSEEVLGIELYPCQIEWWQIIRHNRKALLECALGHGKSTMMYPYVVQRLIHGAILEPAPPRILFITSKEKLAVDYTRRIIEALKSEDVTKRFGTRFFDKNSQMTQTAFRMIQQPMEHKEPTWRAAGINGGIEGTRADIGLLDDPVDIKNALSKEDRSTAEAWFTMTFLGRMEPEAEVVCIGSSWHPEDLYSKIRAMKGWACEKFPAYYEDGRLLCPQRWSEELLEEKRMDIGDTRFKLRYMMDHEALMGGFFEEGWIEYIDHMPEGMEKHQAWDLAITEKEIADAKKTDPDFTAGVTMAFDPYDGKLVLIDLVHERITKDHDLHIKNFWTKHHPLSVGVETNAFQKLIMYALNENAPEVPAVGVPHYEKKTTRLLALQPYYQRGWKVLRSLVDDKPEAWLAFLTEYRTFPHGDHDDILDAQELCLSMMKKGGGLLLEGFDDW